MKKGKGIIMSEAVERLDDRTFFILYALSKHNCFNLPNVRFLYNLQQDDIQYVLNEFQKLYNPGHIKVTFSMTYPHPNAKHSLEMIVGHETELEGIIANMNSNVAAGLGIMNGVSVLNPLLEYLLDILCVNFSLKDEKSSEFSVCLEFYFNMQRPIARIYGEEEHYNIIRKYFKTADGRQMKCNPKTKLSRYTALIEEYERRATRFNFWHFFKRQEEKQIIQVNHLSIDESEPTIDYSVLDEKMFFERKVKESVEYGRYSSLILYNDKIVNRKTGVSVVVDRRYKFELLKYALENPTGLRPITAINLGQQLTEFSVENIHTATSAVNRIIQKVLDNKNFKIIELFTRHKMENRFNINALDDIQQ